MARTVPLSPVTRTIPGHAYTPYHSCADAHAFASTNAQCVPGRESSCLWFCACVLVVFCICMFERDPSPWLPRREGTVCRESVPSLFVLTPRLGSLRVFSVLPTLDVFSVSCTVNATCRCAWSCGHTCVPVQVCVCRCVPYVGVGVELLCFVLVFLSLFSSLLLLGCVCSCSLGG